MNERLPQLEMGLDTLDEVPEMAVPEGYRIRAYRQGDEREWCRLINEGIGGRYDEAGFWKSIARWAPFDPQGLFFAETGIVVAGTACATWRSSFPQDTGYVHMVAVDPGHRGHGIGRALILAVLHRLRQAGFRRAALHTDDWRLTAIHLYLGLGFRPRLVHPSHEARWGELYVKLGRREAM